MVAGQKLLSLSKMPTWCSVWDLESGKLLRTLKGHTAAVLSVCVTDALIISGSRDTTVR